MTLDTPCSGVNALSKKPSSKSLSAYPVLHVEIVCSNRIGHRVPVISPDSQRWASQWNIQQSVGFTLLKHVDFNVSSVLRILALAFLKNSSLYQIFYQYSIYTVWQVKQPSADSNTQLPFSLSQWVTVVSICTQVVFTQNSPRRPEMRQPTEEGLRSMGPERSAQWRVTKHMRLYNRTWLVVQMQMRSTKDEVSKWNVSTTDWNNLQR